MSDITYGGYYYQPYHLFYAESTTWYYNHQEVYDLQVG